MKPIHDLTEMLARLPGLGPRQARRVVAYLLRHGPEFRHELATLIESLSLKTAQCTQCLRYDDASAGLCSACSDPLRDSGTLMVVEHDVDIDAMEASHTYRGKYFVLGGLLPLGTVRKARTVHESELIKRLKDGAVTEVIFALSTTPEGDYTAKELAAKLDSKIKTTVLGRGLSVGAELEYADPETLRSALKNRA